MSVCNSELSELFSQSVHRKDAPNIISLGAELLGRLCKELYIYIFFNLYTHNIATPTFLICMCKIYRNAPEFYRLILPLTIDTHDFTGSDSDHIE